MVTQGRINLSLNLSRAFGDMDFKSNEKLPKDQQMIIAVPDIVEHSLDPSQKFFLLGCDGIWETQTKEEICEYINNSKSSLEDTSE